MSSLPWGHFALAALIMTLLASSPLGEASPRWMKRTLNALIVFGGLVFLVGAPLAHLNQNATIGSDGARTFTMETPPIFGVLIGATILAVLVVSTIAVILGAFSAKDLARASRSRFQDYAAAVRSSWRPAATGVVVALMGGALCYLFGGPIVWTPEAGLTGRSAYVAGAVGFALFVVGGAHTIASISSALKDRG